MIVDIVKYFIMGTKEHLDRFFERAQDRGFLEFISISSKKPTETPAAVQTFLTAIKILRKQPLKEQYQGGGDLLMATQVAERVLELKEDLEKLYEEKRVLDAEIARVAPFGDFSMEDLSYIEKNGRRKIQFFCMKTDKSHEFTLPPEVIYVGTEYDLDYYIAISQNPIQIPGMIEMRIDAPIGELENRLDFVEDSIHRFENELKDFAEYLEFLQAVLVEELNKYNLFCAKKEAAYPLQNSLFMIEAWVPKNKVPALFSLVDGMDIHIEEIAIEKDDKVPTCLDNRGLSVVGEDLIKIYDIPATTDKDPSNWVLWFFALFFAMIVNDGGYGLLFLVLALFLQKKFPKIRGQQKRMLKLLFILSTICILWGICTSSYFGLKLSPDNFLSRISPMTYLVEKKASYHLAAKDDVYQSWVAKFPSIASATSGKEMITLASVKKKSTMTYPIVEEFSGNILLEFTLVVGIVHVMLAFLRYLTRNYSGLGWIAFMIGGYLYFPSMLNATTIPEFMGWVGRETARAWGIQLIYGGISFAILAALIRHKWAGLKEITNLVQVFSDVLSYLRLYALGLAGSIMASTFNQEGTALGLFLGFLAILAGHGINVLLSFMGGVIHGLRLNFLEWYHYCFSGDGRLFKPLQKIRK